MSFIPGGREPLLRSPDGCGIHESKPQAMEGKGGHSEGEVVLDGEVGQHEAEAVDGGADEDAPLTSQPAGPVTNEGHCDALHQHLCCGQVHKVIISEKSE